MRVFWCIMARMKNANRTSWNLTVLPAVKRAVQAEAVVLGLSAARLVERVMQSFCLNQEQERQKRGKQR
jgi:hypothetical protein